MLWVPYPSSETLAADSCSHFHPRLDAGSLTCSLPSIDLGCLKQGRNCGSQSGQTWDSTACCLKWCRQTNGRSASLVTCNLHRCLDAQASWRGSGVVLESLSRSSGRTLEAQLTEIRFTNSSDEGLSSRLMSKDLVDCSCSNGKKLEVQESDAEAEEKRRRLVLELCGTEEKRLSERSKNEYFSSQLGVKRTLVRSPACSPGSPVPRLRVNETMLYLESIGVDCSRAISQEPRVAACNVHRVRGLVHALEYYGLKRKELGRVINTCPKIVRLTAENDLKPVVDFLQDEIGFPRKDVSKLIKRCPRLLAYSVDEQLRPTLLFLRTLGFSSIGGAISSNPTLLSFSVEKNLVPKLEYLESLGLSHNQAASMVVRFPAIFNYSVKQNLQLKYDYLVNEIGGNLDDLMAFPQYFGYSLEKRIKPRHQHITKYQKHLSLATMLKLSEVEFLFRLENSKAEQLYKVALLSKEENPVNCNGAVLKSSSTTDLKESGTPALMGARRS